MEASCLSRSCGLCREDDAPATAIRIHSLTPHLIVYPRSTFDGNEDGSDDHDDWRHYHGGRHYHSGRTFAIDNGTVKVLKQGGHKTLAECHFNGHSRRLTART